MYRGSGLVYKSHFVEEVGGAPDLFNGEEDVADVQADVAAEVHVEVYVAHCAFPYTVEVDTDEVSFSVDHWATRVSTSCVVSRNETYWNFASLIDPTSEILVMVDVSELLRNVIIEDLRIVLFDDSFESR